MDLIDGGFDWDERGDVSAQAMIAAIVALFAVGLFAEQVSSTVKLETRVSTRQPLSVTNDGGMLEAALLYGDGTLATRLGTTPAQNWTQGDGSNVSTQSNGQQITVTSGTQAPYTVQIVSKALPPGTMVQAR